MYSVVCVTLLDIVTLLLELREHRLVSGSVPKWVLLGGFVGGFRGAVLFLHLPQIETVIIV